MIEAMFRGKSLGSFSTWREAMDAYRAAERRFEAIEALRQRWHRKPFVKPQSDEVQAASSTIAT
jgi:hypothetical protein